MCFHVDKEDPDQGMLADTSLQQQTMGASNSTPKDSPLGCLLNNWAKFDLQDLKKKRHIFYCNTVWPQYNLNEEKWPTNSTLSFNAILQLDLFCRRLEKWSEMPYIQAFMALYQDSELRAVCRMCLASPTKVEKPTPDILDDDCLVRPIPKAPAAPTELTSPEDSKTKMPPPYDREPKIEASIPISPAGHTRSGTSYNPGHFPLREVANGEMGTIRVHVPFSMSDMAQLKTQLGRYSENPSQFIDGFQQLVMMFELTWQDIYIILTHCCTTDERNCIWAGAREFADELHTRDRHKCPVGGTAVPDTDPKWDYMDEEDRGQRNHMATCLIEGMKKGFTKPVNFDKLWEITQGTDENPALFQGRLAEAIRKYTNLDPTSPEGITILNMHFISQSAPDIRRKLTKLTLGPQIPVQRLLEVATQVFHDQDLTLKHDKDRRAKLQGKAQAHILAAAIADMPQKQANQGPKSQTTNARGPGKPLVTIAINLDTGANGAQERIFLLGLVLSASERDIGRVIVLTSRVRRGQEHTSLPRDVTLRTPPEGAQRPIRLPLPSNRLSPGLLWMWKDKADPDPAVQPDYSCEQTGDLKLLFRTK
uniref:Core shell protein Gag P30 domain-containing protein n=1 Tax=Equus caballus TaxID=9796 RepID=A0A9L0S177_HORSE